MKPSYDEPDNRTSDARALIAESVALRAESRCVREEWIAICNAFRKTREGARQRERASESKNPCI